MKTARDAPLTYKDKAECAAWAAGYNAAMRAALDQPCPVYKAPSLVLDVLWDDWVRRLQAALEEG